MRGLTPIRRGFAVLGIVTVVEFSCVLFLLSGVYKWLRIINQIKNSLQLYLLKACLIISLLLLSFFNLFTAETCVSIYKNVNTRVST